MVLGVVTVTLLAVLRVGLGGVLVVLRDVSTLDEALRMKADFVANAGHELRTPVAAIKLAHETLSDVLDDEPLSPPARRCLSILGGHLLRMEELLRDLMDLSRVESGQQRPTLDEVAPASLLRELETAVGPAAREKGVALHLSPPTGEDAAAFVTDSGLLMLALKNLTENAVKYTPTGGRVEVQVARRGLGGDAADVLRQLTDRPYSEVEFVVRDTGVGIPAEHVARVFERFYQVDPARTGTNARTNPRASGRGTGLGLSIVKHAVSALGGVVRLESEPGRGSTFTITLPQVAAKEAEEVDDLPRPHTQQQAAAAAWE